MQNCLLHHPISIKLCCPRPKCTLVQNYIVNLDLHVCCPPQKYYTMHPCPCAPPVYVCHQPAWKKCPQTPQKSIRFVHIPCEPPKKIKMSGATPTSHDIDPPCTPYCTMQVSGAQCSTVVHNVVLYPRSGA